MGRELESSVFIPFLYSGLISENFNLFGNTLVDSILFNINERGERI